MDFTNLMATNFPNCSVSPNGQSQSTVDALKVWRTVEENAFRDFRTAPAATNFLPTSTYVALLEHAQRLGLDMHSDHFRFPFEWNQLHQQHMLFPSPPHPAFAQHHQSYSRHLSNESENEARVWRTLFPNGYEPGTVVSLKAEVSIKQPHQQEGQNFNKRSRRRRRHNHYRSNDSSGERERGDADGGDDKFTSSGRQEDKAKEHSHVEAVKQHQSRDGFGRENLQDRRQKMQKEPHDTMVKEVHEPMQKAAEELMQEFVKINARKFRNYGTASKSSHTNAEPSKMRWSDSEGEENEETAPINPTSPKPLEN